MLQVSLVKGYVSRALERAAADIAADRAAIAQLSADTASLKAQAAKLRSSAQVIQNSRCAASGALLELPVVHFMCGHSFNLRSLGEERGWGVRVGGWVRRWVEAGKQHKVTQSVCNSASCQAVWPVMKSLLGCCPLYLLGDTPAGKEGLLRRPQVVQHLAATHDTHTTPASPSNCACEQGMPVVRPLCEGYDPPPSLLPARPHVQARTTRSARCVPPTSAASWTSGAPCGRPRCSRTSSSPSCGRPATGLAWWRSTLGAGS